MERGREGGQERVFIVIVSEFSYTYKTSFGGGGGGLPKTRRAGACTCSKWSANNGMTNMYNMYMYLAYLNLQTQFSNRYSYQIGK